MLQAVAIAFLLCAAGCGRSRPTESIASSGSWPLTVQITRLSDLPANAFPPFTLTSTDAHDALLLFIHMTELPALQTPVSCPVDSGLSYRLTFAGAYGRVQRVTVRASGCREVVLGPTDRRATNAAFWSELAHVAGVQVSDLSLAQPLHTS